MKKQKSYDWEVIEKDFRAGVLSIREIAKQHGCAESAIRKHMKRFGIERDLSKRIDEKVRTELVRSEVRAHATITEKEIVEQGAATKVAVVREHRACIKRATKIVDTLFSRLTETVENAPKLEGKIKEATKGSERAALSKAMGLPSNASTVVQLTTALKTLIGLERQAFNLEEKESTDEDIDRILVEFVKGER